MNSLIIFFEVIEMSVMLASCQLKICNIERNLPNCTEACREDDISVQFNNLGIVGCSSWERIISTVLAKPVSGLQSRFGISD